MTEPSSFQIGPDGSVLLSLADCCVQTAAKRAHRELTAALLDGRASESGVCAAVDLLRDFLSSTDFAVLRSETPALAVSNALVHLHRDQEGAVRWAVVDAPR
jgi:hypothetical protein